MISPVLAQISITDHFTPPFESLGEMISVLLPNLYILAGVIFLVLLIAGGFGIIISSGKGMKEGIAKGSKTVTVALIGLLVIIGSYWLIQIISAITGIDILTPF